MKNSEGALVLVIAAHPDDEILGVGGTIAAHVHAGDRVSVAVLCEGVSVRYSQERQHEVVSQTQRAAGILGVSDLVIRMLPDQRLDTLPLSQVVGEIENLLSRFKPRIVYTHFGGDVNHDHRVLAEAVLVAARPYAATTVREVLMFETPSSTEWGAPQITPVFQPTLFVNITDMLEKKLDAFKCYTAEVREFPHPRSLQALRDRARYWGSMVNCAAAEAFTVVRSVR